MLHFILFYIIIKKESIIFKLFYHSSFQLKMKNISKVFSKMFYYSFSYLLFFHDNLIIF